MLDFGLKERGFLVSRRPYTPGEITNKLRQAEVLQSRWGTCKELHRKEVLFERHDDLLAEKRSSYDVRLRPEREHLNEQSFHRQL
jgi:hypothetical protein